jgi:hypothetical protein
MKVIKAMYDFIVGDMIILIGVIITVLLLYIIQTIAVLRPASGVLLILALLIILIATLYRETRGKR